MYIKYVYTYVLLKSKSRGTLYTTWLLYFISVIWRAKDSIDFKSLFNYSQSELVHSKQSRCTYCVDLRSLSSRKCLLGRRFKSRRERTWGLVASLLLSINQRTLKIIWEDVTPRMSPYPSNKRTSNTIRTNFVWL